MCVLICLPFFVNWKSLLSILYFVLVNCFIILNQGLFILLGSPTAFNPLNENHFLISGIKLYGNNGDMHENFNHQLLFDLLNTKKIGLLHIIIANIFGNCIRII